MCTSGCTFVSYLIVEILCEGPVLSRSTRWERYWFRSPHSMYSVTIHKGSLLTHTPSSRMMFGSFRRDKIFTSFRKSFLKERKKKIHQRKRRELVKQEKEIKVNKSESRFLLWPNDSLKINTFYCVPFHLIDLFYWPICLRCSGSHMNLCTALPSKQPHAS